MADENKGAETPPTSQVNEQTVVSKKETTEVIGNDGNPVGSNKALSSIFDKIEAGQPAAEAVREVMDKKPAEIRQEKKEEKIAEVKKEEEKSGLEKRLEESEKKAEETQELSRENLRKQTEEKKPVPAQEQSKEPPAADEVPDEDLQVLPHDKPKTAKRIQALLKKIDSANSVVAETKKEADAKAAKLKELESKLSEVKAVDPTTDAAVKAQLDELAMYRRQYELEKDPEVKTKFDSRIESADKSVPEILKRNGADDGLLKLIEDEGGWYKFASSNRVISLKDGSKVSGAELADQIIGQLPLLDRKSVEASVMERIQVSRDKDRYIQEEKRKASDYFKNREQEVVKQTEQHQAQIKVALKTIEDWQKEAFEKNEFLKEKPVPSDASPEVKASIEEDNKYTKQLGALLKQSVAVTELPKVLDMVLDSVKFYDERRRTVRLTGEVAKLKADLAAKQAEIDKFRQGARSITRSGSIAGTSSDAKAAATARAAKPPSLEDAFNRIAAGERLDGKENDEE